MEPLCYHDDDPLPARDEILRRLNGQVSREAQLEVLHLLCPCRNTFRDPEVWRFVIHLSRMHYRREVREGAHHAVMSLRERARIDTRTAALLREIGAGAGQRRHGWLVTPDPIEHPKPVRNDVPTIIEMLASDDEIERRDALRALFRTDRHVAAPVWREIDRARHSRDRRLAAKAARAIERLASV